ncbi:MAG: response regulator transcription factor [Actinomycetota bacterium]|nr:response regulator transcription factor [Actinomycetota bacterium]
MTDLETAYRELLSAGPADTLTAQQLEALADAAFGTGRMEESFDVRERAYAGYDEAGDALGAGRCATWLAQAYFATGRPAIGGGWMRRAQAALAGHEDEREYGDLLLLHAHGAQAMGQLESSDGAARAALDLGMRLRDADLQALALQILGSNLLLRGDAAAGLTHLDDSMMFAVEGRLSPMATGLAYCTMIAACEELGDVRRVAEWTTALKRWTERHPFAMFPGICRVHRATVLRRHGSFSDAEEEARRACNELESMRMLDIAAAAYVEVGEVRRRVGDLAGAETAFHQSQEITGVVPVGLALVRLAQGRLDEASTISERSVAATPEGSLARAAVLPVEVQVAVAVDDLERAGTAADELDSIAGTFNGPALLAQAATARGRLQLAKGDCREACATLHSALRAWLDLDVPHEAATVRLLIGEGCRESGDPEGAVAAFNAAARAFERLGAALDLRTARDSLDRSPVPGGLTEREAEVLCLVATGLTNKEIAARLFLSDKTVARHLSNIFVKLGVTSRAAATAFAFEHGIARPAK